MAYDALFQLGQGVSMAYLFRGITYFFQLASAFWNAWKAYSMTHIITRTMHNSSW